MTTKNPVNHTLSAKQNNASLSSITVVCGNQVRKCDRLQTSITLS